MPIGPDKITARLCRDRRGVSAIEFALIAPAMVALMFGAYDFGNAAQQQIQLQAAVRAGGAYAISRPTDGPGIQAAVTGALPNGWALSSAPSVTCSSMDPATGALTVLPSCLPAGLANAPANSGKAISITATMAYTPLFFSAISTSTSATYVVRFQ